MRVCVNACAHVRVYACMRARVCMRVRVYACMRVRVCVVCVRVYTCARACTRARVRVFVRVCVYAYVFECVCAHRLTQPPILPGA